RKVPTNLPMQDMLTVHLGKPLTQVPDPYEKFESLGHHNNAMLRRFLDSFGFEYEFQSASDWYKSGKFDPSLKRVMEHYDEIMDVILPTLGPDRRATYSPFLPICPATGVVLQVPILERNEQAHTIVYRDPQSEKMIEVPITGGHVKLQWKADWGMRWAAFDVDYEMSGKDLIDSVKLSSKICKILGGVVPIGLNYEHFLDEEGQKISKSKGNGLTIDDWLSYAPTESLSYYMYQTPKRAKRLFFDVIPKNVDDYLAHLEKYHEQPLSEQIANPVWHIHSGNPPQMETGLSFGILLNLVSVCNTDDPAVLWGFVARYMPGASAQSMPFLDKLLGYAIRYYQDFVKPHKEFKSPSEIDLKAISMLKAELEKLPQDADAHTIQTAVFEVGKQFPYESLREWFKALYQVLLGQSEGPRMGSFIALYGIDNMIKLIKDKGIE
ncbi:MAG: lysine--tRNA ligase, partial [Alphaproteobacteria bacterium]|nr:lysine--tRNA ligase [Alphaproteobacteria bacterium]